MGGVARTTNPTAVADGDRVDSFFDKVGRPVVVAQQGRGLVVDNNITLTTTTETSLLAAGAAGVFHDLVTLIAANTSATGVRMDLRDATAGTVLMSLWIPATDTRGFNLTVPKPQAAAATAWTAQLSAAVTDVRIYALAVKNI